MLWVNIILMLGYGLVEIIGMCVFSSLGVVIVVVVFVIIVSW